MMYDTNKNYNINYVLMSVICTGLETIFIVPEVAERSLGECDFSGGILILLT